MERLPPERCGPALCARSACYTGSPTPAHSMPDTSPQRAGESTLARGGSSRGHGGDKEGRLKF